MEFLLEGAYVIQICCIPISKDILLNAEAFTKPKVW
jgi:hypothetical protein